MTRDELIKVVRGNTHHSNHFEPIMAAVDAYSAALLQQTPCKTLLPSLEDAWNAGVDEGRERTGNFEWGIRRKNIEFSEWYESELKNNSSGQ